MKYFYLSKEYAKNNGIWIYKESETPIKDYMDEFGIDAYEYIGNSIPNCPWYDEETDSVVEMPYNIKILKGIVKPRDGEYLDENNEVVYVEMPSDMIVPIWNKELHIWEESYVESQEIPTVDSILDGIKFRFYNYFNAYKKIIELNEYKIITVTDEEISRCQEFLKTFNPNSECFDMKNALDAEINIPEIIKNYL